MSKTERWVHPKVPAENRKLAGRDYKHHAGRHRFSHELRNDLGNLRAKVVALSLVEALDPDRAPRLRHNHKQPYFADDGKKWDRMVRHYETVAWQRYDGQSHTHR